MRLLLLFSYICVIPALVGCQSLQAVASAISGSAACSRTEQFQNFPDHGAEAEIHFSLDIFGKDGPNQFSAVATCEYQGSMCGGGSWFQVWYGDQSEHHVLPLPDGSSLHFRPHNFCIRIDQFRKGCQEDVCKPQDHFTFSLELGDSWDGQAPALPGKWGSMSTRRFSVGIHEIHLFGFEVKGFEMTVHEYLQELEGRSD